MSDLFDFQGVDSYFRYLAANASATGSITLDLSDYSVDGQTGTAIMMVGAEYVDGTTRAVYGSQAVRHTAGEVVTATLLDVDLYNLPIYSGNSSVLNDPGGYQVINYDTDDDNYDAYLLADQDLDLFATSGWFAPNVYAFPRQFRHGSGRNLDFRDGGSPRILGSSDDLGISSHYGGLDVFIILSYDRGVTFSITDNPTNEWANIAIKAPQASQFHDIQISLVNMGATGTSNDTGTLLWTKPPGYVEGSCNFGWGGLAGGFGFAPPYGVWWVYRNGIASGPEVDSGLNGTVQLWQGNGFIPRFDMGGNTQEFPELSLPLHWGLAAVGPVSDGSWFNQFSSLTTMKVKYLPFYIGTPVNFPEYTPRKPRCGIALWEEHTRRTLMFGQELGSTELKLWTHTTQHNDSVNSFAAIDSVDCHLGMHEIFLRVYVDKDGPVKFLYSADNINFFVAFSLSSTTPFFTYCPTRVGPFMWHDKSVTDYDDVLDLYHIENVNQDQRGRMDMPHFENVQDSDDVGLNPETYYYVYDYPEPSGG